jgi:hypothetical protein
MKRGTSMASGPSSVSTVLPRRPVAVIRRVVGFGPAGRVAQMVRERTVQRALDHGLLEATDPASSSSGEIGPWRTN